MSYTPISCTKAGEVSLHACLNDPFISQHAYIPQRGWNAGQVHYTGSDPINYTIAGYINYLNDGTNESLFTDLVSPDVAQWGGYYTGSKFMAAALNGGVYSVGVVSQAYTDPTDTTAASMTITSVGDGGVTPPGSFTSNNGPFERNLAGPSANGGDEISWFEGRTTEVHILTSDGTDLTREQAFPLEGAEQFRDFAARTATWIHDGTDFWHLSYVLSSTNILILTRFKPTPVGDPYDYEKFQLTLSDSAMQTLLVSNGGPFILSVNDEGFFVQLTDYSSFGNAKYLHVAKDGTSYTEYVVTGTSDAETFAAINLYNLCQLPSGRYRLSCPSYAGDGDYAVGTYDLLCTGGGGAPKQGHCYARKRTRFSRPAASGPLIPSGDMQDGSTVFAPSADGDYFIWKETGND